MKEIFSVQNKQVKEIKKLHKKKYRERENKYIIEGYHLIEEAEKANREIQMILFNQRGQQEWAHWLQKQNADKLSFVSDEVLKFLSELPTPQGIMAIVSYDNPFSFEEHLDGKWLLLDNVQDPGNVGTMIRTADAAGFTGVILGDGTADIYSCKVLRAMQGSNYHLPVIRASLEKIITDLKRQDIPVYGTELNKRSMIYRSIEPTDKFALIMGNEGKGVSPQLLDITTKNLYIPILGAAESLNVSVAAGIIMYHLSS